MDMPFYKVSEYLYDTLGMRFKMEDYEAKRSLPFFLSELYEIKQLEYEGRQFILFKARKTEDKTPLTLQNHADKIHDITGLRAVYVAGEINSYDRKRLADYRVPFIVPYNQMYLPDLGIDFREYFKGLNPASDRFNPSTQVVILRAILNRDYREQSVSEIAALTGYAKMTITRAFEEIAVKEIGEVIESGKERLLRFRFTGRILFERTKSYLRTPVKSQQWMIGNCHQTELQVSGLSALSVYTNLADDRYPTFAVTSVELRDLKQRYKCKEIPSPEPGAFQLEFWKYKPLILAEDRIVDRLSLYLSLIKDETDDRTLMALNDLLEGVKW